MLRRGRLHLVVLLGLGLASASCGRQQLQPSDPPACPLPLLLDARDLLAGGDSAAALNAFQSLAAACPDSVEVARGVQDTLKSTLPKAEYLLHFAKGTEASPSDPTAWYLYGRSVIEQEGQARAAFEKALLLNPAHAWSVAGLAYLERRHGDLFGAVQTFEEGVARAPRSLRLRLLIAHQYIRLRLHMKALRHLQAAEQISPGDLEVKAALGEVWEAMGESELAMRLLSAAHAEEPRLLAVVPPLTRLLLGEDRASEAVTIYRAALERGFQPESELAADVRTAEILLRLERKGR